MEKELKHQLFSSYISVAITLCLSIVVKLFIWKDLPVEYVNLGLAGSMGIDLIFKYKKDDL